MSQWDKAFLNGGIHTKHSPDLDELIPLLKSKGATCILDAGCGNGRDSLYLAEKGFEVTAIDGSLGAIKSAEKNSNAKNLTFEKCNLNSLPFPDESFDFILAGHSIEYNPNDKIELILTQLKRVLKKEGLFYARVLSTKHPFYKKDKNEIYGKSMLGYAIKEGIPIKFFSEKEIKKVFQDKRFKIKNLRHISHPISRTTGVPLHEWLILAEKLNFTP